MTVSQLFPEPFPRPPPAERVLFAPPLQIPPPSLSPQMLKALEHGYTIAVSEVSRYSPEVNVPEDIEEVKKWNRSICL